MSIEIIKTMQRMNRIKKFLCEYRNALGTQNDLELERLKKELLSNGYWDMQFLFSLLEIEITKEL